MATTTWTSDRRLYLDAAGRVVEAGDPARAILLVIAGGTLPLARARALGLVRDDPPPAPAPPDEPAPAAAAEPKGKPAPANKAKRPSEAKDGTNAPAPTDIGREL